MRHIDCTGAKPGTAVAEIRLATVDGGGYMNGGSYMDGLPPEAEATRGEHVIA
jgi:hypothetical protein